MDITAATTVHDAVERYPYLLEWLVSYDPSFKKLKNPALFNTMARVATLGTAASMANVDPACFVDDVRTQIAQHEIAAEEAAGAQVAPAPPPDAEERQAALKAIIRKLHDGASVEDVKRDFDELIVGVDSAEIARMEQTLIAEGMPVAEVQRLCDVHVAVFKESLDTCEAPEVASGHPIESYERENRVAGYIVTQLTLALGELGTATADEERRAVLKAIDADLTRLAQIETHYARKENQLFPVLESHGIEGPTKVMWSLDDEIRGRIKSARSLAAAGDQALLLATLPETLKMIDDMVYKEEKILFPTALGVVTDEEWSRMAQGDADVGFAWIDGPSGEAARAFAESFVPTTAGAATAPGEEVLLPLPTGALSLPQLDLLFRSLPVDVTFVDENDRVRFYSEGDRVFPRAPGVIGREVRNCHPPKSLGKVEQILAEFKAGTKDAAEFWIEMGPVFVHIRYFALRDDDGAYRGCLEVVQDATHVRGLTGERRIVDW